MEAEQSLDKRRSGSDAAVYILCAVTFAAIAFHSTRIGNWPGWQPNSHPGLFAYACQFFPFVALVACAAGAMLNYRGRGKAALNIVFWFLIPTLLVVVLDACTGSLGMVD